MTDSEMTSVLQLAGLPLPSVSAVTLPHTSWVCAVSPIGAKGRISDSFCVRELGWRTATPIKVAATVGRVVVTRVDEQTERRAFTGEQRVDVSGHLRLLTAARRVAGFSIGERLLLVADLVGEVLHIMSSRMLPRFLNLDQMQVVGGARWDG